jgi:uncharacterized protein YecE (DUF72 family)
MATDIRIGTASWTDPGFIEDWYPRNLPASARLRWYAEHFNYVEVNATFYAIPTARTVERWVTETPDDFLFDVKLPKALSRHRMQVKFLPPDVRAKVPQERGYMTLTPQSEKLVAERFLRELRPLCEAKKLGAFLLQLSPAFGPTNHELGELDSLHEMIAPRRLAVELRNRDWATGKQLEATLAYFRSRKITFVLVDAPKSEHFTVMPGLDCVTNPELGYFRFHGRNEKGYVSGRTVADRFNHDYTPQEVSEIAARIVTVSKAVKELHAVANNNRADFAPTLAMRLQQKMDELEELRDALKRTPLPKQGQLI